MKKLVLILSCVVFFGCNKNDIQSNCNFLFDAGVNLTVDTTLPQFSQLAFAGNAVYVPNQGNNGIWLWRLNSSTLYAWDAADPSHQPTTCSTLTGTGSLVTCGCDDGNKYDLNTGTGLDGNTLPCTLKPYRVEAIGNNSYFVSDN